MKNPITSIFLLIFCALSGGNSFAQIFVRNNQIFDSEKLTPKDYDRLKGGTLYFVAPGHLVEDEEEFKVALEKAWKYTAIEIIEEKDIEKHIGEEKASFFSMGYLLVNNLFSEIYYELWQLKIPEKGYKKTNMQVIAKFNIDLTCETLLEIRHSKPKEIDALLQKKNEIPNFKPGIIANYLRIIDNCLTNREKFYVKEVCDKEEIKNLAEDTLYITTNFLQFMNFNNDGCYTKKIPRNEVIGDYQFPYKLITPEELNQKLMTSDKFYYLLFSSTIPYLTIFHSDGKYVYNTMIYGNYKRSRYMEKLAKLIEK